MNRRRMKVAGIVGLAICAIGLFVVVERYSMSIPRFIANADKIEFFFELRSSGDETYRPGAVLTDATEIAGFADSLTFTPREPCECIHSYSMRIWRGKDALTLGVCGDCFEIYERDHILSWRAKRFDMPREFWARFSKIEQARNKKSATAPTPVAR